jgi:hypothetical protein
VFLLWFPHISSCYQKERQTQSERELLTHFEAGLCLSSLLHILSYNTVLPYCSLNLRDTAFIPKMAATRMSHWEVIKLLFPPGAGLNLNPGSYQSDTQCSPPLTGSCTSLSSIVHLRSSPRLARRTNPLWIKLSIGTWWDLLLTVRGDAPQWQGRW